MMMRVKGVIVRTSPTVVASILFAEIVGVYLGTRPIPLVDQYSERALESAPVRHFFIKGTSAIYWRGKRVKRPLTLLAQICLPLPGQIVHASCQVHDLCPEGVQLIVDVVPPF